MELIQVASKNTISASDNLASYSELKRRVWQALGRGRKRAEDAVEREKVRTSWEVGKLIDEHLLLHKERAEYGKQVINRLSAELGTSDRELRYMVEFARTYPISPPAAKLSWGHYRDLLSINEDNQRKSLIGEAARKKWTRPTLRREIGKLKAAKQLTVETPSGELLKPIKGNLDTYRIVIAEVGPWQGKPVIDLGFSNYLNHEASGSKEGDIVTGRNGKLKSAKAASEADLFTYRAWVLEVTDGDTLWVLIELGFGFTTKQQLRLRGLDAPEITSRDGQKAKRFVESQPRDVPYVVIASTKSDKYDRYLADVFYTNKNGEQFLNNRLLQARLADRI